MNKKVTWIIYNDVESKRNKEFIKLIFDALHKRGMTPFLVIEEDLTLGKKDSELSIKYRGHVESPPYVAINRTRNFMLGKHLEFMGVAVYNSSFVSEICNNKMKTHEFLKKINVPLLDTKMLDKNVAPFFPMVIKPVDGKGGEGVFFVNTKREYQKATIDLKGRQCIVQKPASILGKEVRTYVIGDKIIVSILKEAKKGFKSNFCLGSKASIYELSNYEKNLINRIVQNIDFGFVGIDYLFNEGGIVISEIEDVVGSRAVYEVTDINIADLYVDYIAKNTRRGRADEYGR